MKLAACFLTLLPGFAVATSWTSPGFPAFSEQGTGDRNICQPRAVAQRYASTNAKF
jgi:hypothetical protein